MKGMNGGYIRGENEPPRVTVSLEDARACQSWRELERSAIWAGFPGNYEGARDEAAVKLANAALAFAREMVARIESKEDDDQ